MTVSSQTSRIEQLGDGTTTAFAVNFYFLENSDLKVFVDGLLQTITTNYTVTGAGNPAGGTVTFVSAPANGVQVVIFRDPALTQGLDYIDNDPFPAESHERGLDKLTMIAQRVKDLVSRALRLGDSVVGVNTELPALSGGQLLGTNPGGTGFQLYPLGSEPDTAGNIVYTPEGTGAVATTVQNFLRQIVSVKDFGAVGDGITDDTAAIQAALTYANALSSATSRPGGAPLLVSSFPAIRLQFPAGKYLVSAQLTSAAARIRIEGDNALVFANNGVIPASYLFRFTGGYDVTIDGLNICSTETGCIEVNAANISSSTFNISNCNFIGNNLAYGTAIKYSNQSSILKVEKCLFQNVKHAYEYVNCDWQEFSNCWFDFAFIFTNPSVYADGEGYFKNCGARFIVQDSLFAGGPGVSGNETAYFEVPLRCDLTLRRLRISQEGGGGVIVNWKFPINLTNGSGFLRQGITIEDIECSPRDDNYSFPNGTVSTPLIRLFEMPNYISLRNINMRNTPNGFIAPAASTTLETLYQAAKAQSYLYTQTFYELKDIVGNQMYLAATTDALVHKKWLELFNCFNYLFDPDSINNAGTHKVRTFFTGNQLNSLSLDVRLSVAHGLGQRYQYRQIVSVVRTGNAGNHEFRVRDVSAIGVIGSNSVTIDPVFRNINTGVEAATIPVGSTLTDFIVVLNINLVGGSTSNFKVIDCWAIPEYDNWAKTETNGTPRQFITKALP